MGFIEGVSTAGEAYLVLYIFPRLDSFSVVISMSQLAIVPSVLNIVSTTLCCRFMKRNIKKRVLIKLLLSVCPLTLCVSSLVITIVFWVSKSSNLCWLFLLCVCLKSLCYWDNFVDDDEEAQHKSSAESLDYSQEDKKVRTKTNENHKRTFITSGARLLVCAAFYCVITFNDVRQRKSIQPLHNLTVTNKQTCQLESSFVEFVCDVYQSYGTELKIVLLSFLMTQISTLACRLHLQRIAFTLPTYAAPVVTLALVWTTCKVPMAKQFSNLFGVDFVYPLNVDIPFWSVFLSASLAYVALLCLTWYLWFPKVERMAKLERYSFPLSVFMSWL